MTHLVLENVGKVYTGKKKTDTVQAVTDFNLEVKEKEFIVFVGPSGCGKSTTLRMIAGLEDISMGNLYIDGELMNAVEPKYRNIAMVFQNYALYPHMSAYDNMAFGLRNMKVPTKLTKNGEPVLGIDKKAVADLKIELKNTKKAIEKAKKLNDETGLEALNAEVARIEKDIAYFQTTPVELFVEKHLSKEEIDRRIKETAKILEIEELLDRKPGAMSGGQRQRVALGRAIVRTPKVFLLDEPLSNLDAKLRGQMRVEITKLYEQLDIPFIYVTHDQVEAMTMGTRIVVMRKGYTQQIDTPTNLYDYPVNRFVAGFLGTPQMNFFEIEMKADKEEATFSLPIGNSLAVKAADMRPIQENYLDGETHPAIFGIRSEDISLCEEGQGMKAKVILVESLGSESLIYADLDVERPLNISSSASSLVIKLQGRPTLKLNDIINIKVDSKKIHLFSADEEKSILGI